MYMYMSNCTHVCAQYIHAWTDMQTWNFRSQLSHQASLFGLSLPKVWGLALSSAISGQKFRQILNQSNKNALFMLKRLEGLWHVVSGRRSISPQTRLSPIRVAGVKVPTCRHGVPQAEQPAACSLARELPESWA